MTKKLEETQNDKTYSVTTFQCQRDGLTIRGTEYRPAGENLPVAIVCHGFMSWQGMVQQYAQFLAEIGYCAYSFDFCGGCVFNMGKSDGLTTDMSVLTEVKDLEAVISYVRGLPYASENLLLMGCSQGGFVSALTAAKHPDMVKKLILFYPALCIPDGAREGKLSLASFDPKNIPDILECGPVKLGKCYAADVMNMDPFDEIRSYPGPVLIVHGTEDQVVHVRYAQHAQECYSNAQLHFIEGGTHGFSKEHDVLAMGYIRDFLAQT